MADYEPVDISGLNNAPLSVLGDDSMARAGAQSFRGLPFLVGGDGSDALISLGGGDSVLIPLGSAARRVIFAHRLMETKLPQGGPLGVAVADYIFHYAGGAVERVTIRERFEIAAIPGIGVEITAIPGLGDFPGVPGSPFLAVTDTTAELMPRYVGSWDGTGRRQTEAGSVKSRWYYLWAFENPHPARMIEAVEIVPKGPPFVIAAITLGHVDEHPFAREGRRPARIVLTDQADAERSFDLDVEVDRGDSTYVHPLPVGGADDFVADPFKGYGQEQNVASSPAYVEISAVPSATVSVKHGNEEIGSVRWGDVVEKGTADTGRVRVSLADTGKNWVHVMVLDDDTGKPVPCRVHFRSPEGIPFQPHGHHNQVNSNLGTWHIDVGGDVRLGQITLSTSR